MTGPTDDSRRDAELERAWRVQSSEAPSPELDRTILAAAHRAVDSRPTSADATRSQRWWMPWATAATIGAVVIGMRQLAPLDQDAMAPTVVASVPDKAPSRAPLPQAAQPMSREERQRAAPATESEPKAEEIRPAAPVETPSVAPAAPPIAAPVADVARRAKETEIEAGRRDATPPPAVVDAARSPAGAGDAAGTLRAPAPASLAKLSISTQAKARDPVAWIARIRKLREDGRIEEAQMELREFRAAFGDAEHRLPPELRTWMKP